MSIYHTFKNLQIRNDIQSSHVDSNNPTVYVNGEYTDSLVDGSRFRPYKTIQAAIDSLGGDKIHVIAGTYEEDVVVGRNVALHFDGDSAVDKITFAPEALDASLLCDGVLTTALVFEGEGAEESKIAVEGATVTEVTVGDEAATYVRNLEFKRCTLPEMTLTECVYNLKVVDTHIAAAVTISGNVYGLERCLVAAVLTADTFLQDHFGTDRPLQIKESHIIPNTNLAAGEANDVILDRWSSIESEIAENTTVVNISYKV